MLGEDGPDEKPGNEAVGAIVTFLKKYRGSVVGESDGRGPSAGDCQVLVFDRDYEIAGKNQDKEGSFMIEGEWYDRLVQSASGTLDSGAERAIRKASFWDLWGLKTENDYWLEKCCHSVE